MENKKDFSNDLPQPIEVLFDEDRELFKEEYSNLREKQKDGYFNVGFFRNTVFNPTSRGSREKYTSPKVIWRSQNGKDPKNKDKVISVSHNLHQKHADVLSILFSDNFGMSKPSKDGGFFIYTSLYHIAKKMGYKNPASSAAKIKCFLDDMRHTDFIVQKGDEVITDTMLGKTYYNEKKSIYIVKITGSSAKILAHSTGIKIEKELNQRIVSIPDKLAKIKAVIRYMHSHRCTLHGFTLELFYVKFTIGQNGTKSSRAEAKSKFKRLLKDNTPLLNEFNIEYSSEEEKLFYHEEIDGVDFKLPMNTKKVLEQIKASSSVPKDFNTEVIEKFKGKEFLISGKIHRIRDIQNIREKEGLADITLYVEESNQVGVSKDASLNILEKYIENFKS